MWEFLIKINNEGTTIILTTHYLEEAENLCKKIAIIDKGQIIKNSNMRDLLASMHHQTLVLIPKIPYTKHRLFHLFRPFLLILIPLNYVLTAMYH